MTRVESAEWLARTRDRVLDGARLRPGDDVLDLRAGSGLLLAFGAHERIGDGWVYAVDASVTALEELLRAAHERNVAGIAYLVGDAEAIPLPDGSVDACVARSALVYVADLGTAAAELHRVLRPGGRLSLHEPVVGDDGALAAALTAAGFVDVQVEVESADDRPAAWVSACRR